MSLIAGEEFQHILHVLNTNVDGRQKIMFALTSIKRVGRRFANLVCKKAEVDISKRTKKLEVAVKLLSLLLLPVPLFLWPVLVAVGSVLVGLGYGFGTPLVATFEAVGENRDSKFYHAFAHVDRLMYYCLRLYRCLCTLILRLSFKTIIASANPKTASQVVGITGMCGRGSAGVNSRHSSNNLGSVSQEPLLAVQRMESTTSLLNRTTWCLLGSCVCPVCRLGSYIMACRCGCVCSVSHHLQSHFGGLWGRSCVSGPYFSDLSDCYKCKRIRCNVAYLM
ncbi:hypothetical protein M758_UG059700 [Ceratodon purpureus]|nr:hypothetical protein M758_UG059700 [Ceratodon purpureus]